MANAKMIPVGDGLSVQFTARARGEETRAWSGKVYLNGARVGDFDNSGRGEATRISPPSIQAAFERLVDNAAPECVGKVGQERAELVIAYADALGYNRKARSLGVDLKMMVQVTAEEFAAHRALYGAVGT